MNMNNCKEYSRRLSQITAVISLIVLVFIKSKVTLHSEKDAGKLVLIILIAAGVIMNIGRN